MYTPRGCGVSELGDIEVVPLGDELHLLHLTLPNHDVVQHAVSRDGLTWAPLPHALRTGDPGACDDDQIWTMSVTPRPSGDGYVMLYTALASADHGRVQRIAAATSTDLIHWEKCADNPVSKADPRWYESRPGPAPAVSWRDPKATRVGSQYLATICARELGGPLPRRGCVGLMVSDDLDHWDVRPPLFAPKRYWDLECPQLFRLQPNNVNDNGPWHLTAAIMEDRSQRYWFADDPLGPFHVPPCGDQLAPPGHYAARIAHWRGLDLLFAWRQPKLAEGWMTSPRTVDWVDARNPFGKFLAPPLVLSNRGDGSLALASFSGWNAFRTGEWRLPQPGEHSLFGRVPISPRAGMSIASNAAMDLVPASPPIGDFMAEGMLAMDAARGGLALRLDDEGCGLYVEITPGARSVSLQHWGIDHSAMDRSARHHFAELQQMARHVPNLRGVPMSFRLLSVGPYVEMSLDGDVVLATMTGAPSPGSWGIWVQDGAAHASDLRWAPMRQPGAELDDVSVRPQEQIIA